MLEIVQIYLQAQTLLSVHNNKQLKAHPFPCLAIIRTVRSHPLLSNPTFDRILIIEEMSLLNGGRTVISIAAENKDDALLWASIEYTPYKIDLADINCRTPLSFAAAEGSVFGVDALLEHGADPDAQDVSGRTPLSWAAAGGHIAAAKSLLENNAQPESQDIKGQTPLIYACISGHTEMVSLLLEWNHTLLIKRDFKGMSPLCYASVNGHIPAIKVLLTREAVIRDWILEDWKEKTLKSAVKAKVEGKWSLRDEMNWELENSNMPQTHALRSKNRETLAVLNSYWNSLPPDLKALSPAPSSPRCTTMKEQPRGGHSLLLSANICYPEEGRHSRQEQAFPGENEPWNGREPEEIGHAEAEFRRAEWEVGMEYRRRG